MGTRKPRSTTAALVKGRSSVADDEHPDRLPIEETWPPEHLREQDDSVRGYNVNEIPSESAAHPDNMSQDDGTEPFGTVSETLESLREEAPRELDLSTAGPFIAPAPAPEAPASTTTSKRAKLTVASMTREQAFTTFRDKLFELCFKYGFTLDGDTGGTTPGQLRAYDIGDAKGTAKRALAVGNHISGLELRK